MTELDQEATDYADVARRMFLTGMEAAEAEMAEYEYVHGGVKR